MGLLRCCRPKWKRRPAADAETGDVRRPRSYDLSRFDGQVESTEPRVAFRPMHEAIRLRGATCPRIPAVRGGSAERRLPIVIRLSPRKAMVPRLRWNGAASHALFQLSPRAAMVPV